MISIASSFFLAGESIPACWLREPLLWDLKDTLLVNYCLGPGDPESLLAERMAKHSGLSFQRIQDINSGMDVGDVLTHAGSDYRTPFCDHSAVPIRTLAHSVIRTFGPEFSVIMASARTGHSACLAGPANGRKSIPSHALLHRLLDTGCSRRGKRTPRSSICSAC